MKSLTEQQLRDLLLSAYALGQRHSTDVCTETLKGERSPDKARARAEETMGYLTSLIASV